MWDRTALPASWPAAKGTEENLRVNSLIHRTGSSLNLSIGCAAAMLALGTYTVLVSLPLWEPGREAGRL